VENALKIAVKIGGHLFPTELGAEKIIEYAETLTRIVNQGNKLLVVTGGGGEARKYIDIARKLGADETVCDQIGIDISRLNAYLLISKLGNLAYPEVPTSIKDAKIFFQTGKIVVMGGLTPGHSTTAVGALMAEAIKADFYIIATDVDGIYTADPKIDRKAKKLDKITARKMLEMALAGKCWAGTYALDPLAIKVIERSKIPTYYINGRDPKNIERTIKGEKIGTHVVVGE
jgi:uridylate kinase